MTFNINKKTKTYIWLLSCIIALLADLFVKHSMYFSFLLVVCVLTFPSGFMGLAILVFLTRRGEPYFPTETSWMLEAGALWLLAVIFGYIQWFVFVPWMIKKLETKKHGKKILKLIAILFVVVLLLFFLPYFLPGKHSGDHGRSLKEMFSRGTLA